MTRIVETRLVCSTGKLEKLPPCSLPEVAFAGRSNVGKSSLLNALCNRKNLFKVSQTPGRTRTIVFADARLDTGVHFYLVDLPGFGFAKVAKEAKIAWGRTIEGFFKSRATLHLVFVLVDLRRGIQEDEADLFAYLDTAGIPARLVATKIDRLPKNKRRFAIDQLCRQAQVDVIATSTQTRQGLDDLIEVALKACSLSFP